MAITVDEFVNPKSMITPGAAAALVAVVAGAFFSMFGIRLQWSLPVLSFFVGCVVFYSREFSEPAMTIVAKGFFYSLNSLIIFAMATGTHAALDRTDPLATAGVSFILPAYAQKVQQQNISPLKQKRPFFYNWTKEKFISEVTSSEDSGIVKFTVSRDLNRLRDFFVDVGLTTSNYEVQVEIDKSKIPGKVKTVTWSLPKAYFSQDKVVTVDENANFEMNIQAWKSFEVGAQIELESGEKLQLEKIITFSEVE